MSVDYQIDRILRYLRDTGQLADTMVVFWSDNGVAWGDHNWSGKFVPYLPSVNVPLFVHWPGHVSAGEDTRLVSNVDITPTILDAAGIGSDSLLHPLDGHSLLTPAERPYQFNEHFYDAENPPIPPPAWAQVHTTKWSYTEYYDKAGAITFREYYNLRADPGQRVNLLGDKDRTNDPSPDVLAKRHVQLAAGRTCVGTRESGGLNPCP